MEDPDSPAAEPYYRCWAAGFAVMPRNVAPFDDVGSSQSLRIDMPEGRTPDAVITTELHPYQTLMYRLTGEFGPPNRRGILADTGPPMLPGLCTLGIVTRGLLKRFGGNEGDAFHALKVRLSGNVFSGQTLQTSCWVVGAGEARAPTPFGPPATDTRRVLFHVICVETGEAVLESAYIDLKGGLFTEEEGGEEGDGGTSAKL